MPERHQVIIVGAGPGGITVAAALHDQGITDVVMLEKGQVGQAWLEYPTETHLLSESAVDHDDNMIAGVPVSAVMPNIPHPNSASYPKYLQYVIEQKKLQVQSGVTIRSVVHDAPQQQFLLEAQDGRQFLANFVVWAAGMYNQPNDKMGSESDSIHYARMPYLREMSGAEVTVVGSANGASGVVLQLARPGRVVTLVTTHEYVVPEPIDCLWKEHMQFVQHLVKQGLVKIVSNFRVQRIFHDAVTNAFILEDEHGARLRSPQRPILCTGFSANITPIKTLIEQCENNHEMLISMTPAHESIKTSGLYLAGVVGKLTHDDGFIRFFRNFGQPIAADIAKNISNLK